MVLAVLDTISETLWRNAKVIVLSVFTYAALC